MYGDIVPYLPMRFYLVMKLVNSVRDVVQGGLLVISLVNSVRDVVQGGLNFLTFYLNIEK